jgi:DNA-binding NarL/FixJ family response regulator
MERLTRTYFKQPGPVHNLRTPSRRHALFRHLAVVSTAHCASVPHADYSFFVQRRSIILDPETHADLAAALVVVDERGDVFAKIRSMELGTGIWRTLRPPEGLELPESTLVLIAVYEQPDWDAIRECSQRYPTVVLSANARREHHLIALRAGAFGYVDLAMDSTGLHRTLLGALRGEPAYPREALGTWMREGRVPGRRGVRVSRVARLTARQTEIVNLIAGGATDKEIGAALGIRTATAQKHVANLLRRLGVANRAAAVGLLFKEGDELPTGLRRDGRRR